MAPREIISLGGSKFRISPENTAVSLSITEDFVGQKIKANRAVLDSLKT
jgi:hypothetical protein